MPANRNTVTNILLVVAFVFAPQIAPAQTNTFPGSGNAGVGTTTPTLQSGTTNTMVEVKGTVNPGVGLTSTASGGRQYFVYSSQTNPGYFSVFDATAGADRFVIGSTGNVGIGTSTPNAKFVIASGNVGLGTNSLAPWTHATSVIESLDSSIFFGLDTDLGLNSNAYHNAGWKYKTADAAANVHLYKGDIYFRTAGAGSADAPVTWADSMFIKSNGNVGIGTSSPATAFHVKSTTATVSPRFESTSGHAILDLLDKDDTKYSYINFGAMNGRGWQLGKSANSGVGPDGGFYFYELTTGSGGARLAISKGGNVGIGTTSPGQRLSVAGTVESTSGGFKFPDGSIQATAASGSSQWSGTGPIYYTGGNVGIGTANPDKKLVVIDGSSLYLKFLRSSNDGLYLYADGNYYGLNAYDFTNGVYKPMSIGWGQQNLYLARDGGNVGIGTSTPQSTLQIGSQTGSQTGGPVTLSLGGSFSNAAGANLKLKLYDDGVASNTYGIGVSSGSMDFGVSPSAAYKWYVGGVNKMTLANNGDLSVSGNIAAKYQDLAEWVPSSEQLSAGTVVVLDTTKSNQVISSTQSYDTRVAGVISSQPGITLGESGEGKVLVATTGRVRVKVDASRGPIQIGDLLVTSDVPGVAMKSEAVEFAGRKMHMPGTIIGKALEPLAKGSGEILVLLSLQ